MQQFTLVVQSSPVAGKESEYNRWYNEQHLPDVLKVPGMVSAQRFCIEGDGATGTPRYLALYDIECDDINAVMAELTVRVGTAAMPMTDALDMTNLTMNTYRAITPLKHA